MFSVYSYCSSDTFKRPDLCMSLCFSQISILYVPGLHPVGWWTYLQFRHWDLFRVLVNFLPLDPCVLNRQTFLFNPSTFIYSVSYFIPFGGVFPEIRISRDGAWDSLLRRTDRPFTYKKVLYISNRSVTWITTLSRGSELNFQHLGFVELTIRLFRLWYFIKPNKKGKNNRQKRRVG